MAYFYFLLYITSNDRSNNNDKSRNMYIVTLGLNNTARVTGGDW
jgi:hypothetical protein